jgi:predicted outer membrane repeat protein
MKKLLIIFAFLMFLLISPSFANENTTEAPIGSSYGDVYFNSSSLSDGDGSIENPYNKITMDRINNYATLHLADGEYNVTGFKTISSLSIVGESQDRTIVRHEGLLFTVLSELSLDNLTLSGVTIKNQGLVNSTNVIFSDSMGSSSDIYNNIFGGVFNNLGTNYLTPTIYLDNCVFRNNHAEYGGAIYLINSNAFIYNCVFEKNIAYNYGGAIACDGTSRLTIKNTLFKFDSSTKDAGGALYLKNASINIESSNFTSCNSTFGGAICDLNSDLSIKNAQFSSNTASYDGGAIFKMYGDLSLTESRFSFNSAQNGGAIFADNSSSFIVQSSRFSSNNANNYGGAIYSLLNKNSRLESNIYTRNKAKYYPNTFETDSINMFIGNNNYSMFKYNFNESDLPTRYSSLDEGYVTPVKDQQASGNCWAFTAIATLESCILKASNITYDLSEENMKNLMELYSDYGWKMDTNNGGYDNMAVGYLVGWLGPVLEENDPFDDYSTLSPVLNSIMHIQNIIFLGRDNLTDNDKIKEAILKYGAVGTGLYYSESYLFGDAYYYSGTESENHAVTIVGWDDDYPYYKFRNPAPANGAWIVKNSWDDNWADNGYFYVSYYDTRFARIGNAMSSYTFVLNDTLKYDKNYQYDIIGFTKFLSTANNEVWYENVFNSTEDEVLAAFSTYFNSKTNWTVNVIVNDEYVLQQNGTASEGYYTFDFDNPVYLNEGDSFKIIVKLENNFASVPLSEKKYSNKVFSKKGISFLSYDGNEWYDLYTYENSPVASLKAFTIIPSISLMVNSVDEYYAGDSFNLTSFISDSSLNGSVFYEIGGDLFIVNVTDGLANLQITFNEPGDYESSAYFVGEGIFSNKVYFTIKIKDKNLNTIIKLDNITSEVDKIILVNASIYDENNQLVRNGNFTLTVGKDTYICPIENGSAVCEISFNMPGNYTIVASFNGANYNPSSKIINVEISKSKLMSNFTLNASVVYTGDEIKIISNVLSNNITVDGGFAVFSINNTEYKVNISNNNAVLDVVFNQSGNYIVDVSFSHEKYDIDDCSSVINVSDRFSRISISDLMVYVGDKCNVSAVVFDEYGGVIDFGILKFSVCGEIYDVDLSVDQPVLGIIFNESGFYNVFVEFDAFGYEKSFNNSVIEVSKKNLNVNFTIDDICYGDDLVINISSDDAVDVEVIIDNVTYNLKTNTTFAIENMLNVGVYESVLIFKGNALYNSFTKKVKFTVNPKPKENVTITVTSPEDSIVFYNDPSGRLIVELKDSDGNPIGGAKVKITVGDLSKSMKTYSSGKAYINTKSLGVGDYVAVVSFAGDDYYAPASVTANVAVRVASVLVAEDVDVVYQDANGKLIVELKDGDGNPIGGAKVKFTLGSLSKSMKTYSSGKAYINTKSLGVGDYVASVSFAGDDYYAPASVSVNVAVRVASVLVAEDVIVVYQDADGKLIVELRDANGNPIGGAKVKISVGSLSKSMKTYSSGKAYINTKSLGVGDYVASVSFAGDDYYAPASVSVNVAVRVASVLVAEDVVVVYQDSDGKLIIELRDANGNPISGVKVKIAVGNLTKSMNTRDNGKAYINTKSLGVGDYVASVSFAGDDYYAPSSVSVNVAVRMGSVLTAKDVVATCGDSSKLIAELKDTQGNPISGVKVKFTLGDLTKSMDTSSAGKAYINTKNLAPGNYKAVISFPGNKDYAPSSITANVLIKEE